MDHFTADDGEKIHLKISGDGPPLVLLHGWTSTHRDWNPFIDTFAQHFRVYRWDARGHGGHPLKNPSVPTVERMARDLQNLLDHYRLDQAVAVGHSMGALTLWQYLRDFGDSRLSRLVFIDQSPRLLTGEGWQGGIYGDFGPERSASFMAELRHDFAEAVLRLVAFGHNPRARELYQQNGPGIQLARERLRALEHVLSVELSGGELVCTCEASPHNLVDILDTLRTADVALGRVWSEPPTLNDVFLEITGRELRD